MSVNSSGPETCCAELANRKELNRKGGKKSFFEI